MRLCIQLKDENHLYDWRGFKLGRPRHHDHQERREDNQSEISLVSLHEHFYDGVLEADWGVEVEGCSSCSHAM